MTTTHRTANAEGADTIAIGDESNGVVITVLPADETGPMRIEVAGRGSAVIADGGLALDHALAAALGAELFTLLTGLS